MEQLSFKSYPNEQLEINSIDSKLLKKEKVIRRYLMNYTIDSGQAFNIGNSCKIADDIEEMNEEEITVILDSLLNKDAIVADEQGNINFIYPVSAISTNHKVRLADGRIFSAMCAIDAMGTAFTFNQDVDIESKCSNCGDEIKVSIRNGKLNTYKPSDLHILHVDLNKNTDWSGEC